MTRLLASLTGLLLLLVMLPSTGTAAAAASRGFVLRDPTPLTVVAREAGSVESDGVRYAVLGRWDARRDRYREELLDSWSGRRSWLPDDCQAAGIMGQTTMMAAGRMLLHCGGGYTVLTLASGRRQVLPGPIAGDGLTVKGVEWLSLGRRWVHGSGTCVDGEGAWRDCQAYVDLRSGATRLFGGALRKRTYRDLDAAELPLRTLCRRRGPIVDARHRFYAPPYWVGWHGMRRCSDGSLVRDVWRWGIPSDFVDGTLALWAGEGSGGLYELRRDRVLSWTLPRVGGRARPDASVAHTRCAVFFAATLRRTEDDYVAQVRVFRAARPAPRDARCRAD